MVERTEELRRDIEDTRDRMSVTLDAIGDRVSPGRVAERRWNNVRQATNKARESVMGRPRAAASGIGDRASSAASTVTDGVHQAPDTIKEGTQGNPLLAGGIAFGLGALLGGLAPTSREEQQVAAKVMEPVKQELSDLGHQVTDSASSQAQQAVQETKATASEAVGTVKEKTRDATDEVKHQAGSPGAGGPGPSRG